MHVKDVRDMFAYIKTLPADATADKPHQIGFPSTSGACWAAGNSSIWMTRNMPTIPPMTRNGIAAAIWSKAPALAPQCHSPRDPMGGIIKDSRFAGAKNLDGPGWISQHHAACRRHQMVEGRHGRLPGNRPDAGLRFGRRQHGRGHREYEPLTADDRKAMAAYLVTLPPHPGKKPAAVKK